MSREFEDIFEDDVAYSEQSFDDAAWSGFSGSDIDYDGESIDLRKEILQQMTLLRALRGFMFHKNGRPKQDMPLKDIRSVFTATTQLLSMLQRMEESLRTDEEVRRIEAAVEMALEDCPCPEFAEHLRGYLTESA